MSEQKAIPDNCWMCEHSYNCYSSYGEGACKYRIAIEERERKEGESNAS